MQYELSNTYYYQMKEAVQQVVDVYGSERVELLMAKIVQNSDWDGRYSRQNKDWANGFEIPQSMKDVYSDSHPILLDGFLEKMREKPSVLNALRYDAEKGHHGAEPNRGTTTQNPTPKRPNQMEV